MCPDPDILSAYRDGEIPSPWAERIAAHAASCEACRARLEAYAGLSAAFRAAAEGGRPAEELARSRVAARLDESMGRLRGGAPAFWKRSLLVPLPLAAAVLLLALVPTAGLLSRLLPPAAPAMARSASPAKDEAVAALPAPPAGLQEASLAPPGDFADFDSLLEYLNAQDSAVRIIVEIPANRQVLPGGPAEIRKVPPAEAGAGR